jgi:catechol 2,3-dioxygenase-like lactoylglutathione lyase family enzyme
MLGRLHHLIVDCPDPAELARFYASLLGQPITYESDDFVVVAENDTTSGLGFQRADDHRPPTWPDPAIPQQMHLDIKVGDLDEGERQVLAMGARRLEGGGETFRVFADPAGHPFCLIPRPGWAEPLSD